MAPMLEVDPYCGNGDRAWNHVAGSLGSSFGWEYPQGTN